MIDLHDSNVWAVISSNLAQKYRVLPIRIEAGTVVFVAGDSLTQDQLTRTERLLAIRLGRHVVLETIDVHPDIAQSFDELLDKFYGVFPDPTLTLPVGSDMMTVLLICPQHDLRKQQGDFLQSKGFRVFAFDNPDDAVSHLTHECCRPGRIVVSHDVIASHGRELEVMSQLLGAELTTDLPTGNHVLSDW